MGVLAVFAIAGLMHSGRTLPFPPIMWLSFLLILAATATRIGPDLGLTNHPFGAPYVLASALWAGAALTWLVGFWPILTRLEGGHGCG